MFRDAHLGRQSRSGYDKAWVVAAPGAGRARDWEGLRVDFWLVGRVPDLDLGGGTRASAF